MIEAIRIRRSWVRCAVLLAPFGATAAAVFGSGGFWSGLPLAVVVAAWGTVLRRSGIKLTAHELLVRQRVSTLRLRADEVSSITREPWRHWDAIEVLTFRTPHGGVVRADYPWAFRGFESPALDQAYHDVAQWLLARQPEIAEQ